MEKEISYYLEFIRTLSSELVIRILLVLSNKYSYPREIAEILGVDETTVSRKLKKLEKYGLVESKWIKVGNKNVKAYSLVSDEIILKLSPLNLNIILGERKTGIDVNILSNYSTRVPRVYGFINRRKELNVLKNPSNRSIYIWGLSGIGKTWLVTKYVSEENTPVLWIDLNESTTLYNVLWRIASFLSKLLEEEFAKNMYLEYITEDNLVNYLSKLNVKFIIVFDGYERIHSTETREFIRNMLFHRNNNIKIIVISRFLDNELLKTSDKVIVLKLNEFTYNDIKAFFEKRGLVIHEKYIKVVEKLTSGIPLLINVFVNVLKHSDVGVDELDKVSEFSTVKKSLIKQIVEGLSTYEKELIRLLLLTGSPTPFSLIEYVIGRKKSREALLKLMYRGLINVQGENVYLHPIIHPHISEFVNEPFRKNYYRKIGEYYKKKCNSFYCKLKALDYYIRSGLYADAVEVLDKRLRSNQLDFATYSKNYLGLINKIDLSKIDWRGKTIVFCEKGIIEILLGYYDKALKDLDNCLKKAVVLKDQVYRVQALLSKAYIYAEIGRLDDSEKLVSKVEYSLAKNSEIHGIETLYYMLYLLKASIENIRGEHKKALANIFYGLELLNSINNPEYYALILLHLGYTYTLLEDYDKALKYLSKSKRIFRFLGNTYFVYLTDILIANAYVYKGLLQEAEELLQQPLKFFNEIEERVWNSRILNLLKTIGTIKEQG